MNQQVMMRKLMKMKQEMEDTQKEIYESEFSASAGGIVTVTVLGTKELVKVEISEDFEMDGKEDLEMLSDMIVAASNQAYAEVDKTTEEKMSKYNALLGGFGGMF
jgi:DNA-binding YbaB/EbfC family protein